MSLKIEDLKVGDVVIMTDTNDGSTDQFLNIPLTIMGLRKDSKGRLEAYTDKKMPFSNNPFWLDDLDTFEYDISSINEQKLRKLLNDN